MIRFAAVALVASLMATTAFAQKVPNVTTPPPVTGAVNAAGNAASSAATNTKNAAAGATQKVAAAVTGQYDNEAAAKAHCPTDTVVWGNASSKAYHLAGTKYYGKTKHGSYMCQKDAMTDGFHARGAAAPSAAAKPAAKTN